MTVQNEIELYIHIPFCVRKCNYCDFLSFAADDTVKENYVQALIKQIESESALFGNGRKVRSIYFGGGTPSVLQAGRIERIMRAIEDKFDIMSTCERTIEINPGTVDEEKMNALKSMGFNRISIGMQSANDRELKLLGRIHTYEEFEKCYKWGRRAGFQNISVDVMTALPGQDKTILEDTLSKVIKLGPEHISAYSLIIEPGTPFYDKYGECDGPVVGQELERGLYWFCVDILRRAGYRQYEISNFALEGKESVHNSGYWRRIPYIGFGLGASSLIIDDELGQIRSDNLSDMKEYLNNPCKKEETVILSEKDIMDEYMFLGLRMREGVNKEDFYRKMGVSLDEKYSDVIAKFVTEGLINDTKNTIMLTDLGIDYGNYVFAGFT